MRAEGEEGDGAWQGRQTRWNELDVVDYVEGRGRWSPWETDELLGDDDGKAAGGLGRSGVEAGEALWRRAS